MPKKRRVFTAEYKAQVALEAIKEQETINQIAIRTAPHRPRACSGSMASTKS